MRTIEDYRELRTRLIDEMEVPIWWVRGIAPTYIPDNPFDPYAIWDEHELDNDFQSHCVCLPVAIVRTILADWFEKLTDDEKLVMKLSYQSRES